MYSETRKGLGRNYVIRRDSDASAHLEASETREEEMTSKPSPESLALAHEQANFEHGERVKGRRPERIDDLAARKFGSRWVMLAAKGHDIALAMPKFKEPEESEELSVPSSHVEAESPYADVRNAAANDRHDK